MKKALLGLTLALAAGSANAVVIDSFTGNLEIEANDGNGNAALAQLTTAQAIGGFRKLMVMNSGGESGLNSDSMLVPNQLSFSNDDGVVGVGMAIWDGPATGGSVDIDGLGGENLMPLGEDRINVGVTRSDLDVTLRLNIWDMEGDTDFVETTLGATNTLALVSFEFADFTNVDFDNIGALKLTLSGPEAVDARIDFIVTTPVPAALPMALTGIAALGFIGWRRRKAA